MRNKIALSTMLLLTSCLQETGKKEKDSDQKVTIQRFLSTGNRLDGFASCQAIEDYLNLAIEKRMNVGIQYVADRLESATDAEGDQADITNNQVLGVSESDVVKATSSQVFYVEGKKLHVIKRSNWQNQGAISLEDLWDIKLLLDGSKLILVGYKYVQSTQVPQNPQGSQGISCAQKEGEEESDVNCSPGFAVTTKTYVAVYSTSANSLPTLQHEFEWEGNLSHTRLRNGVLSLVMSDYFDNGWTNNKVELEGNTFFGAKCSDVYMPPAEDYSTAITKMLAINLRLSTPKVSDPVVLMGFTAELYASQNNLYIVKNHYDSHWFVADQNVGTNKSSIIKMPWPTAEALDTEAISMVQLKGNVSNRYWLSEKDSGHLFVVTSDYMTQEHRIFSLETSDATMKVLDQATDFGIKEDIKAVRFVDDKLYLVTFRRIDPLYAFDVSDPTSIEKIGELKVPGFSTYLHSMSSNRLIGLGYNVDETLDRPVTAGLKLSLYSVSGADPVELDSRILGQSGEYTSSEAVYDPRAFFADATRQIVAFPYTKFDFSETQSGYVSEAVIYTSAGDQLTQLAKISHRDLIVDPGANLYSAEIRRVFLLGGNWITLSAAGVKVSAEATPSVIHTTIRF